ncbi:BCCT family transporter [Croceicoccus naphthovorans]|uniref:Choline transporter n=1 Tax=Croceicoccus naphthovorans TaxID=1348774 RepID=A0A0G3XG73_9SPHN|nr:BCCT family transporter [Croceicoccus naphthovorans]AKM09604.1 choline transporter [Croceicoccus naphthovorans]MBB3989622.1 choline/glycine/proline betaine transport protein [Croceicoccus naphthovorans]
MATQVPGSGTGFNPTVFYGSIGLIAALLSLALVNHEDAEAAFGAIQRFATVNFGWFLILTVNLLLFTCAYIAISRYGTVRLGGKGAKPEFTRPAWFAMLFSAGMGIGLLFYGVAEPVMHFSNPPLSQFSTPNVDTTRQLASNAQHAMGLTYLHWGLHAWAIYVIIALGLGYVAFNRGKTLSIGSFLSELWPAMPKIAIDLVDILAIVATVCGVATSLGFGASQINAGLTFLFGTGDTLTAKMVIIAFVTSLATLSVALGLTKGIKLLSQANMALAIGLALFLLIAGPTVFLLDSFIQNLGYYAQRFIYLSTWTESYTGGKWQIDWTIFYYAWWISWSPFVGIFIARISYGRTIREFILGTLLVPVLFTFLWMTIFGDSALYIELFGEGGIAKAAADSLPNALFAFLQHYPLTSLLSGAAVIIVATFFVTSADSGALVVAMIASGGDHEAGFIPRVTWAIAMGVLAAGLLFVGGLSALQTAAIVTGLPFAIVLLIMAAGTVRLIHRDLYPEGEG